MSRTRSGASSGSPHPPPSPAGSTHQRSTWPRGVVVPGMRTLLQRLRIHLGEVFRPIRDVYRARSSDPAARKDTDLSDPFAHHPAQDQELHLRVLGVQAHRGGGQGPRHLSSSHQSPGMVSGLSGPSAPGRAAPEPPAFAMRIPVRSGRSDRRAAGKGFLPSEMTALASRTGNRHQPFFGCCPRGVRNWKQACPIFSELPAWSSAWSSPQSWGDNNRIEGGNPGVTTGLKEAILGPRSHWQKKRAAVLPLTGGLDFFPGKNPDLGAGSAGGFYAGQVARPGFYAGQECGALGIEAGRAIKRGWEPVLIGQTRTHWASHQTRLGEPVMLDLL